MDTLEVRFGASVRAARQAKGLTGAALAEKVEISAGTLSKIETGGLWPRAETIERMKTCLGVSWATLFGAPGEDGAAGPAPFDARAVDVIGKLEEDSTLQRRKVRKLRAELERAEGQIEALEKQARDAQLRWLEANRIAVSFAAIYHVFRADLSPEAMNRVDCVYRELAAAPETAAARLGQRRSDDE